MNDTLREYLKKEFSGAPDTPENAALFEELLGNLTDRSRELAESGMSEEEAQRRAIDEMGDIGPLLKGNGAENGKEHPVKPAKGKIYPPEELRRRKIRRGLGVAGAVALYILSVVPALFGDLLALMLFPIAGAATALLIIMLKATGGYLDNSAYSYSPEQNIRDSSRANALLAIGVFFCIVSVVPPCIWSNAIGTALFFLSAAIGVFLIVFSCYLRPCAAAKEIGEHEGKNVPKSGKAGVRVKKNHTVAWIVTLTLVLMLGGFITILVVNDVEWVAGPVSGHQSFADKVGDGVVTDFVNELEIDWRSGTVTVLPVPAEEENIRISVADKNGNSMPEENSVYWGVKDGKLVVLDEKPAVFRIFFGVRPRKYLTVRIPEGKNMFETVSVDTAAADVSISGLSSNHMKIDTVSGDIDLTDLTATGKLTADSTSGRLNLTRVGAAEMTLSTVSGAITAECTGQVRQASAESTSGKITLHGSFLNLKADTTSGALHIALIGGYEQLRMESTSGSITLELGETTNGFSAEVESTSGKIAVNLPVEIQGSRYVSENPTGEIRAETVSGNITFRKSAG